MGVWWGDGVVLGVVRGLVPAVGQGLNPPLQRRRPQMQGDRQQRQRGANKDGNAEAGQALLGAACGSPQHCHARLRQVLGSGVVGGKCLGRQEGAARALVPLVVDIMMSVSRSKFATGSGQGRSPCGRPGFSGLRLAHELALDRLYQSFVGAVLRSTDDKCFQAMSALEPTNLLWLHLPMSRSGGEVPHVGNERGGLRGSCIQLTLRSRPAF